MIRVKCVHSSVTVGTDEGPGCFSFFLRPSRFPSRCSSKVQFQVVDFSNLSLTPHTTVPSKGDPKLAAYDFDRDHKSYPVWILSAFLFFLFDWSSGQVPKTRMTQKPHGTGIQAREFDALPRRSSGWPPLDPFAEHRFAPFISFATKK